MDKLVNLISGASGVRRQNDDDVADRLSSRYTVVLLVLFALLVGMNQYVRNPITCWAPVHFTGPHTRFTTQYCWVKNTYYLPWQSNVPKGNEPRQMIPYYQWIPFILLSQAVLFYFPTVIWHSLNSKAGVDADNIIAAAHKLARTGTDAKMMLMLTNQMHRFLANRVQARGCKYDLKSLLTANCCQLCGRRLGNYLLILFLFSKICYIANIISQLFILSLVLSTKYDTFGFDLIKEMVMSDNWTEGSYVAFPRVTFCDFQIRGQDLANVQNYTVQCVLPINLYNEKIYLFLWFWMLFLAIVSICSFIIWLLRSLLVEDRLQFVRNHLLLGARTPNRFNLEDRKKLEEFTLNYLKQDGALLLRLIAHNTDNITTTEITCAIYDHWAERLKAKAKAKARVSESENGSQKLYPDTKEMENLLEAGSV